MNKIKKDCKNTCDKMIRFDSNKKLTKAKIPIQMKMLKNKGNNTNSDENVEK